jgi:L-lactate utilization protein LutC
MPRCLAARAAERRVPQWTAGTQEAAISLVPDCYLCVVEAWQVVQLEPEAVARLASAATS